MVERLHKQIRNDLKIIAELIPPDSRVLDLGCGNGILLKYLVLKKNANVLGMELSEKNIIECVKNDVPVVQKDLNNELDSLSDNSFDYVILSQTLQAVNNPDKLLNEMLRVGRNALISFINIGYYKARFQLAAKGQMPITKTLPYKWYNTPNIHLGTILDFKELCKECNVKIVREIPLGGNSVLAGFLPNLFSQTCVFALRSMDK